MNEKQKRKAKQEEDDRPSEVQFLAGLVSKTAKIEERSSAWAMSLRVPMADYCKISALCQHSGKSRNVIALHLLRVGLESLADEMPDDEWADICTEANRLHWEARNAPAQQYDSQAEEVQS